MRTPFLPAVLALAVACGEPPAPIPATVLPQTGDTLVVPVVQLSVALPESGGGWLALAPVEGELRRLDFPGRGVGLFPGPTREEVPTPIGVMMAGDTVFLSDWTLRRTTRWLSGSARLEAIPMPDAVGGALPRARDAAGQWYFELRPSPGRDGSGLRDSAAIVRVDPLFTRFDTVARLAPPDLQIVATDAGSRYVRLELSGEDRWGAAPDGTVWIARVHENRVEWHRPGGGAPVVGPGLPDPILPVMEMDRQIFIRRFPEGERNAVAKVPFAQLKPPFERAFRTADGRIWLMKSAVALDSARVLQVVDTTGLVATVRVPSRGIVLGLDGKEIVMGEEFPEGIRVLRYRMP